MKTKLLKNTCKALVCFTLILSLTACGNSNNISKSKKPVTAHNAFNSESVWFEFNNKGIVDKEEEIIHIFSFDGKGKVTVYNSNGLKFAGLKGLKKDDVIKLAKEQDKANFESKKEETIKDFQHEINDRKENYDKLKSEYDNKTYNTGLPRIRDGLPIYPVLSDTQIIAEHEDKLRKWYEAQLKIDKTKLDMLDILKNKVDAIEYKEPQPIEFSLSGKTDKSGNALESETIKLTSYKYFEGASYINNELKPKFNTLLNPDANHDEEILKLDSKDLLKSLEESAKKANPKFTWDMLGYFPSKTDIDLVPANIDAQPVYDMYFRGYVNLMIQVDKEQAGFVLDTVDTKGIDIDKK